MTWRIESVGQHIVAKYGDSDKQPTILATAQSYANAKDLAHKLDVHDANVARIAELESALREVAANLLDEERTVSGSASCASVIRARNVIRAALAAK